VAKTFAEMLDDARDGEEFGAVLNQLFVAAFAASEKAKDESDDED
jgi:hypothetical protein